MELKLSKPFAHDGEMIESISYNLESLTGADIEKAVTDLSSKGIIVTIMETDQRYHAMLFAIASGMAYEDVKRLPMKDFTAATKAVRDFFLNE